ncbi:MAG: M28 family metallopeptidase [Candidatus Acidiferrales bacterium]
MRKQFLAVLLVSAVTVPALPQQLPPQTPTPTHKLARPAISQSHFDGKSWWDYVKFLADDRLEGRETGSEGLRQAESYVVEQLRKSGLEPSGADGFYQPVEFESRQIVEKDSSATLIRDGKPEPLTLGDDVIFGTRAGLAPDVQAPLVFVGYGLQIPENKIDDFAGLDLHGKIAVYITGSPAEVPAALSAHYGSLLQRWKPLRDRGAIGLVAIANPSAMDIPWSRITANRTAPSMHLVGSEFDDAPGLQLSLNVNPASADKFLAGSGHTFAELAGLAKDRKPLPQFPLAVSMHTVAKVETKTLESANVIARLPGTDPKLSAQSVVLSAHIDHLGIGAPINGDSTYNGAMDNASGCAVLLDVAASLQKSGLKLRRSVIFAFVTGEEKGLLGSRFFATHPTVDKNSIVADINIDMFLPIVPLKMLTVYGLTESDLGDAVTKVAESRGITIQLDQEPLRNIFVRSDQYSFIRQGIPSITMKVGAAPGSPEAQKMKDWLTNRYHAPSDDINQPVDLSAAAGYEEIIRALLIEVATNPNRPQWKPDSFFRRFVQEGD